MVIYWGGPTFSRGGGSIETHKTCNFPGGPDPLSPPLDPHMTYGVGTQKNRLNETVLLSTHNTCLH